MGEEILEKVAQLQHENIKLLDELNHLKEHTLLTEETLNAKCFELSAEKKRIKSLEQQNNGACQIIQEKDHLIDSLEQDKINYKQLNTKLSSDNLTLKGELLQEKLKNKQLEIFKTKGENLKSVINKLKEENQRLIFELSLKSEECFSNAATIKDLMLQVKELENEKAELLVMRDTFLRERENPAKTSGNLECCLEKSPGWSKSPQTSSFGLDVASVSCNRDFSINLREELLEVELREKQILIAQLQNTLRQKEEENSEKNRLIADLKKALGDAGLLDYSLKMDLRLSNSSAFLSIYNNLLKLMNWPEGQSTECKPLTNVPACSVIVKDGVQTIQPSSVRIIETISIASQTDPIKSLSPVLPFKAFEKLESDTNPSPSRSDSDEEGENPLSFMEKDTVRKGLQLFAEPKNCDLDMDIYRSCRKLSVLPEEEIDESFSRKSSLKKPYSTSLNSFHLKTHSADDITKIGIVKPLLKATSCSNVITHCQKQNEPYLKKQDPSFWIKNKPADNIDNELQIFTTFPKSAFRQPRSFDSYLDPLKARNPPLPRQASDPTQSVVFTSPVARRGSYSRRPRSTCRPLTLPCDKSGKKREERICKVRFDLNGILPKREESTAEKEGNSSSVSINAKKIKMVSRFTVEIIDEVEFRKSLEDTDVNVGVTRKRPPLIHSVVYKKSVLRDLTNLGNKSEVAHEVTNFPAESPGSPVYDTATEDSPVESFDVDSSDSYPVKRRKQSDASCYSFEDSQSSSEGNDILIKSIKLHSNSKCIIMKDLKKENSDSSCSNADSEIPYIDADDLPVLKPSPEVVKISPSPEVICSEKRLPSVTVLSPGSFSEGSDTYLTPCDGTPVSESIETSSFGPPKSSGLSKSPTVLKNLSNFELLATISESRKSVQSEVIEEEDTWDGKTEESEREKASTDLVPKPEGNDLKRTSSDVSEASESDTLTYGTVKSHMAVSSDCDSDTYVTIWSDKSFTLERKFSDLSENSSSPYNTPPDTSSASFCTPPDTYSPILNSSKKYFTPSLEKPQRSPENSFAGKKREELSENSHSGASIPVFTAHPPCSAASDLAHFNGAESERKKPAEHKSSGNYKVIFDSPKLEFYETNDSVENLEAFLQTEEGLTENETKREGKSTDAMFFEGEDAKESLKKRNSLESPKLLERRKKHPPLSRQNSTEEYNFLDPHDSCLNLSEEMSSPSTTPDTSNKTVIFKNVPLTVSNTIDLDDDFSISETEIQVNFNGSQIELLEASRKGEPNIRYTKEGHCLSEPCTPSISSAEFSVFRKQRSSFTEELLISGKFESNLPEIIVSRLSSESENSESEVPGCAETDFASNVSDRSEIHLSDVNSISGHSDNCDSLSEHSDNAVSDVFSSDSDRSSGISPEITQNSSSGSDKTPPMGNSMRDAREEEEEEEVQPNCSGGGIVCRGDARCPSTESAVGFRGPVSDPNLLESDAVFSRFKNIP